MTPSPSLIAVMLTASYTISTVSNPPSALPGKPRKRVRSPSSTRQFLENRTAALPPASTENQLTLISTWRMIRTTLNQ